MSVIIIPNVTKKADKEAAQQKFQTAIDDLFTVCLIVYGASPDVDKALEIASARASVNSGVRRVIWVRNHKVLTPDQVRLYYREKMTAVVVGLDDKVTEELSPTRAKSRHFVEIAFSNAGG
jgi:hypothetical protein